MPHSHHIGNSASFEKTEGLNAAPSMHNSALPEAIPRAAVSGAIFRGEEVLLVRRGRAPAMGLWSLPGGHIEAGERAVDALARELIEETGITAQLGGVVDAVDVIRRDEKDAVIFHRVIVVFYGIWFAGEPQAASDVSEVMWQRPEDIVGLETTAGLASVIERARANLALHDIRTQCGTL
jgi:8-oxo-dGTP diphosphatase